MASVSRRVHFVQLAALACQPFVTLTGLRNASASESKGQRRASPNSNWFQDWLKVQREEDERVLTMLRKLIGPDGDLTAAYRAYWNARQGGRTLDIIVTLTNLSKAERRAGEEK